MKRRALSVAVALSLTGNVAFSQQNPADVTADQQVPQIEEVSVIGRYVPDEKRNTSALSNVLSAEEFSRAGDSNIAEGLKRVPGLSVVGGKYVYVRGLGDRYSSALLNGSSMPSPEPLNRVLPLDMFPSAVMDSVVVQKTYSAEFPSEFGGGVLQMRTKRSTDEFFFNINSSVGFNDSGTFETGMTSQGGDLDWLGVNDDIREMPEPLAEAVAGNVKLKRRSAFLDDGGYTQEELQEIGRSLPNNYALSDETLPPDFSLGTSLGNYHDVGDVRVNYLAALEYRNGWDLNEIERNTYALGSGDQLSTVNEFDYTGTENDIDINGIVSSGVELTQDHVIRATGILLRKTTDRNARQEGFFAANSQNSRITEIEFIEQELLSGQLEGDHVFPDASELTVNWRYNRSVADRDTPDNREYRYDLYPDGRYRFSTRADANVRRFGALDDSNTDYSLDVSVILAGPGYSDLTLSAGYNHQDSARNYQIRRFTFAEQGNVASRGDFLFQPLETILAPENITPQGFELREVTRPTDAYAATRDVDAWYMQGELSYADSFQLLAGLRREDFTQQVTTFDLFRPETAVEARLVETDYLPSVTATLIRGNHQFRLGYSETTSRPVFRELSPATFTDPVTGREVVGNPDLEVAYLQNYDLRWEWYMSGMDSVSVGLFFKSFDRPIESVVKPGANSVRSFINAERASNRGVELEGRKQLDFLGQRWSDFYLSGNASFIDSEVEIGRESQNILTNTSRPLQGQSDWLFNGQIGYEDDDLTATLLYHYFGDRIDEVGILGAPDLIEEGVGRLDFVLIREFGTRWKVNLKGSNLLDERRVVTQGGLVTTGYHDGRSVSLKVEYRL